MCIRNLKKMQLSYKIIVFILSVIFTTILADEAKTEPELQIVTGAEWGAYKSRHPPTKLSTLPAPYVIISHTASTVCLTKDKCIKHTRNIQDLHVKQYGYRAIGYNFLVGGDGLVYEGRGWDIEGAHTKGYNTKSIGISFIGNFVGREPTEQQLNAAKKLLEIGLKDGHLAANYKLLGHRQVSATESPGSKLYNIIKTWEHWSESP